ncbi:hypothetical protein PAHAL_9G543300 [Panicum hallii]|uniref:Uncharacterized protein n=1 Tax=Panicum hallii TaxID=206008 RepID=A0A2T8I5P9_9POAL|nr:hypothetical protein PAHAL_9G543300 [Panicum hallii]
MGASCFPFGAPAASGSRRLWSYAESSSLGPSCSAAEAVDLPAGPRRSRRIAWEKAVRGYPSPWAAAHYS